MTILKFKFIFIENNYFSKIEIQINNLRRTLKKIEFDICLDRARCIVFSRLDYFEIEHWMQEFRVKEFKKIAFFKLEDY